MRKELLIVYVLITLTTYHGYGMNSLHGISQQIMSVHNFVKDMQLLPYQKASIVPYQQNPDHDNADSNDAMYTINDQVIETFNPWCKHLKTWLNQAEKNTLLRHVLHDGCSAYERERSAIACLVYMGANPNITAHDEDGHEYGERPLKCVTYQDYYLTLYLLEKGADPNKDCDMVFKHSLLVAQTVRLAQLLCRYGAKVDMEDMWGQSVLHKCADYKYEPALMQWYLDIDHVDVNRTDKFGYTPLHMIAIENDIFLYKDDIIQRLIVEMKQKIAILMRAGADITIKNQHGETPLEATAAQANKRMADLFTQELSKYSN